MLTHWEGSEEKERRRKYTVGLSYLTHWSGRDLGGESGDSEEQADDSGFGSVPKLADEEFVRRYSVKQDR